MSEVSVTIREVKDIDESTRLKIKQLMAQSYFNSSMPKVFQDGINNDVKQLCAFAKNNTDEIIGVCIVKEYNGGDEYPYHDDYPKVHFKHMCVSPRCRGQGIGERLVKSILPVAHDHFQTNIIWSGSSELVGIKFYHRLGAWFSRPSVLSVNHLVSPEENFECIKACLLYTSPSPRDA